MYKQKKRAKIVKFFMKIEFILAGRQKRKFDSYEIETLQNLKDLPNKEVLNLLLSSTTCAEEEGRYYTYDEIKLNYCYLRTEEISEQIRELIKNRLIYEEDEGYILSYTFAKFKFTEKGIFQITISEVLANLMKKVLGER